MTPVRMILHQALKDVRLLKWPLLAWVVLLVVFNGIFLGTLAAGRPASNTGQLTSDVLSFAGVALFIVIAALLVQNDSPATTTTFWVTRPISGRVMLVAKLLTALVFLWALPLAGDLVEYLATGISLRWFPLDRALYLLVWLLPLLAIAAVTVGFPQFVLVLVIEVLLVALIGGAAYQSSRYARYDPTFYVLACPIVGFTALLFAYQYLTRRTRRAAVMLGLAPIAIVGLGVVGSRQFPPRETTPAGGTPSISVAAVPDLIKVTDNVVSRTMDLPLTVTGLPEGVDFAGLSVTRSWLQVGDRQIDVPGIPSGRRTALSPEEQSREATRVFGPAVAGASVLDPQGLLRRRQTVTLILPRARTEAEAVTAVLHVEVHLVTRRLELVGTAAVQPGAAYRAPWMSGRVLGVESSSGRTSVNFREAVTVWPFSPHVLPTTVCVLSSRRFGQAVVLIARNPWTFGPAFVNLTAFLSPISHDVGIYWLRAELPGSVPRAGLSPVDGALAAPPGEWLADAELALFGMRVGESVTRTIDLRGLPLAAGAR